MYVYRYIYVYRYMYVYIGIYRYIGIYMYIGIYVCGTIFCTLAIDSPFQTFAVGFLVEFID